MQMRKTNIPGGPSVADQRAPSCDFRHTGSLRQPVPPHSKRRPTSQTAQSGGTGCRRLPVWRSHTRLEVHMQMRKTNFSSCLSIADQRAPSCDFRHTGSLRQPVPPHSNEKTNIPDCRTVADQRGHACDFRHTGRLWQPVPPHGSSCSPDAAEQFNLDAWAEAMTHLCGCGA